MVKGRRQNLSSDLAQAQAIWPSQKHHSHYTNSAKEMLHGFFDGNLRIARDGRIFSGDFE
jgi:hypothetical protein